MHKLWYHLCIADDSRKKTAGFLQASAGWCEPRMECRVIWTAEADVKCIACDLRKKSVDVTASRKGSQDRNKVAPRIVFALDKTGILPKVDYPSVTLFGGKYYIVRNGVDFAFAGIFDTGDSDTCQAGKSGYFSSGTSGKR